MKSAYARSMSIQRINPPGLAPAVGYDHVVVATGTTRVYVAGQTGIGPDGKVVGDDLASQTAQALRNVGIALSAAGAGWGDVVKMTLLIVGFEPSMAEGLFAGLGEAFGDDIPTTATTLHGVQSLFEPEFLVEIDVIAEL